MKTQSDCLSELLKKNLSKEDETLDKYLKLLEFERKAICNQDVDKLKDYINYDKRFLKKILSIKKTNKTFIKIASDNSVLSDEDNKILNLINKKYSLALEFNKKNMLLLKNSMDKVKNEIIKIKIPWSVNTTTASGMNTPVLIDIKT